MNVFSKTRTKHKLFALLVLLIFLALWEFITQKELVSPRLLPSLSAIWQAFVELLTQGYRDTSLFDNIFASLKRVLTAFFFAALIGVSLGLLSGVNAYARAIFSPLVRFLYPLPPLGYYFLLILWLGIDELSKVTLLFLAGFCPIFIASFRAISRINQDFIYQALSMGASSFKLFFYVLLPASLSDIFTGLRIAIGATYSTLVAAEMVAAQSGLGWLVLDASKFMQTDILFVGVILIALLGILLDKIIVFISRFFIHYEGKI